MSTQLEMLDASSSPGQQAVYGGYHPKDLILVNGKLAKRGVFNKTDPQRMIHFRTNSGLFVNSMLSEKEWVEADNAVMEASLYPLKLVEMFRPRGMVKTLGGPGTLFTTWNASGELTPASINMTGQGGENDVLDMTQAGAPVPVIFKPFSFDWRTLAASRRLGDGIDFTNLRATVRVVGETLENTLINGAAIKLNGSTLVGLRNAPGRITGTAVGSFATLANILPTINNMIGAAQNANFYGPYLLLFSQAQYLQVVNQFYGTDSNITPLSRIEQLLKINNENQMTRGAIEWLPSVTLPAGEILLVQLSNDVVDMVEAMPLQTREWQSGDGLQTNFKVMTIAAPRVKTGYNGVSGIVHYTGA